MTPTVVLWGIILVCFAGVFALVIEEARARRAAAKSRHVSYNLTSPTNGDRRRRGES